MKFLGFIKNTIWIGVNIFFLLSLPVFASPPSTIELYGCKECHRFSKDILVEVKKAPDLFFAGNKFQTSWLVSFLMKPVVIRKAGYMNHPGFLKGQSPAKHPVVDKQSAEKIANHLSTLKLPDLILGVVDGKQLSKGLRARAKIQFERNYGCTACHQGINLAGKARGGISGPSLVNAGNRLQADWIFHWLQKPERFEKKGRMPKFKLDEEETKLMVKYIMTLKKERLK